MEKQNGIFVWFLPEFAYAADRQREGTHLNNGSFKCWGFTIFNGGKVTEANIQSLDFTFRSPGSFMGTSFLLGRNLIGVKRARKDLGTPAARHILTHGYHLSDAPQKPPSVGIFMKEVKCQTERATVLGRVKVPDANWLFYYKNPD